MRPWPSPHVPSVPGRGAVPLVGDTITGRLEPSASGDSASLYVCGITPYDATHIGHAATYVAFDLLHRAWLDAGLEVRYVQNVTDVDDPLLERAAATGVDWRDLGAEQIALFASDMTALGVLAPTDYLGAVETIDLVVDRVAELLDAGAAYLPPPGADGVPADVYFDITSDHGYGTEVVIDRAQQLELFGERGGDPDRAGKRNRLDPLLWRAARDGEPSWDGGRLGMGRPGWHIECAAIALDRLPVPFDVQGGGADLSFPHHPMCASHARVLTGRPFARRFVHAGLVHLDGEKMSKSRGNLEFVSRLIRHGVDPAAIRLALSAHHYRGDWHWSDEILAAGEQRLDRWRAALSRQDGPEAEPVIAAIRERVADDLDAPGALGVVDAWVEAQLADGGDQEGAPGLVARAVDRILGIRI